MSNFILVAMDTPKDVGGVVPAFEILRRRLHKGIWPLYSGTKNRNAIQIGDRIIFYVGGKGPQNGNFVATAVVSNIAYAGRSERFPDGQEVYSKPVEKLVRLAAVASVAPAIPIKRFLDVFEFFPTNKKRWGVALVGGSRRISDIQFNIIIIDDSHKSFSMQ